ncbi:hypothetical protein [Mesoplasma melaleucae]|uniref:Uncharacterized protein n=1 Tax=Mesoplasma melaleucae TaxID=81459 RepID=A0A2K8NVD2_9MOLU|nr:hypothetical protein [Mesoplasma melaleucae]ATZ17805.1 hypothetical protein EMELA_v1c02320 [Mesoplasma melaleucae]
MNKSEKIWKFGEWVWVKSPLDNDFEKNKNTKQKRIACILSYNPANAKFKVQMLTNRDLKDSNWILVRKNNEIISGRKHYKVNIWEKGIVGKNEWAYESDLTAKEINILLNIKDKEVYKYDGTFLGYKEELGLFTKTVSNNVNDTIYNSLKDSPEINNLSFENNSINDEDIIDDHEMIMS